MSESLKPSASRSMQITGFGEFGCRVISDLSMLESFAQVRLCLADVSRELPFYERPIEVQELCLDKPWRQEYGGKVRLADISMMIVSFGNVERGIIEEALDVQKGSGHPYLVFAVMPSREIEDDRTVNDARVLLTELSNRGCPVVSIPFDDLFEELPEGLSVSDAYACAVQWVSAAIWSFVRPFLCVNVSNIRLDRLAWIFSGQPARYAIGVGWGEGPDAEDKAIDELLACPMLASDPDAAPIDSALLVLNVSEDVSAETTRRILKQVKGSFESNVKLSSCISEDGMLAEGIRLTVLVRRPVASKTDTPAPAPAAAAQTLQTKKRKIGDRKAEMKNRQMMLGLPEVNLGIFSSREQTRYNGDNLDEPTYARMELEVDQGDN